MEQEGPESKIQRTVAGLLVFSLLPPINEIPVSYVATHETDERPVYDNKTSELLPPHLERLVDKRSNDQTSTVRTCTDRIGSRREGQMSVAGNRWIIRALRWKWSTESDLIASLAQHSQMLQDHISKAASIKNERGRHTRARLVRHQRCVLARTATTR